LISALLQIALLAPLQITLADSTTAPSAQAPSTTPPPVAPAPAAEPAPAAQPAPADDFDLLPATKAPDAATRAEIERDLALRRKMLQAHQLGGFLTLASMTATVVLGQLDYSDKYGGGGDTGKYHLWHRWFGFGTAAIFAGTGSLSIFAPSPLPKPVRLDTATIHKTSLAVAAAGMLALIILGPVIAAKEGQLSQRDWALAHQIVGYATLAATATGAVALTF
jgi:hypothetical protein